MELSLDLIFIYCCLCFDFMRLIICILDQIFEAFPLLSQKKMAEKVEAYLSNQKNTIKPDEVAENFQVLENYYVRK